MDKVTQVTALFTMCAYCGANGHLVFFDRSRLAPVMLLDMCDMHELSKRMYCWGAAKNI